MKINKIYWLIIVFGCSWITNFEKIVLGYQENLQAISAQNRANRSANALIQSRPGAVFKTNERFKVGFDRQGVFSLKSVRDAFQAELVRRRAYWAQTQVRYRIPKGDWQDLPTDSPQLENLVEKGGDPIVYKNIAKEIPLHLSQSYNLQDNFFEWTMELQNLTDTLLEIGDWAITLPVNGPSGEDTGYIFENQFVKRHFISGHGSFIYFIKPSGLGPMLLATPLPGTHLEYFDNRSDAYINSLATGSAEKRSTWRQTHTSLLLQPKGEDGDTVKYGFRFHWVDGFDQMRQVLYEQGLFDIRVVPGMTLPSDLTARFALHTHNNITSITAEHPEETTLRYIGENQPDTHVFEVEFGCLGENMLTIHYGPGYQTVLEFFSTEPLETLIKKRSAFLVEHQQHRDQTKWYDGLFSQWDMKNKVLRGPDNTDGFDEWWGYVLACDDPGLCKAPLVASKNVHFPDAKEIEAVEYYLENFVWGKMQRSDEEIPYPYGIYGTPNWYINRDPKLRATITRDRNQDKMHVWRAYDYPHIIMLYYHMYEIAKYYPDMVNYLDAAGYLERAWQTARAFFLYPYEILPYYQIYQWGFYNEVVILNLIDTLKKEGFVEEAQWLTDEWEKKAKYMIYDDRFPYRSEYAYDRTAYESTYAYARYGVEHTMEPDENLWWDKDLEKWYSHPVVRQEDARDFMERQLAANLACRGWLETAYYYLGADISRTPHRHTMSYMAQMGGWAVLDYALRFAEDPDPYLQLGYASYLSAWALMNTGTEETNYGYWYPGKENDGATGWAFKPEKFGSVWIRKEMPRGPWWYDGEIDLGYGGALRSAATIVNDDALFGLFAYGGQLEKNENIIKVIPKDSLRKRFYLVGENQRIHLLLNRDGFAKDQPIAYNEDLSKIEFLLENRTADVHQTTLTIGGLPAGKYEVVFEDEIIATFTSQDKSTHELDLPVKNTNTHKILIRREI